MMQLPGLETASTSLAWKSSRWNWSIWRLPVHFPAFIFQLTLSNEIWMSAKIFSVCPTGCPLRKKSLSCFDFWISDSASLCCVHRHECGFCWWALQSHLEAAVQVTERLMCFSGGAPSCDLQLSWRVWRCGEDETEKAKLLTCNQLCGPREYLPYLIFKEVSSRVWKISLLKRLLVQRPKLIHRHFW